MPSLSSGPSETGDLSDLSGDFCLVLALLNKSEISLTLSNSLSFWSLLSPTLLSFPTTLSFPLPSTNSGFLSLYLQNLSNSFSLKTVVPNC
jgi:hypothetical protein